MKVTLLQTDICWGNAADNIKQAETLMNACENSDLYVLPEMWSTGFATQPEGLAHDENRKRHFNGCVLSQQKDVVLSAAVWPYD